MSGIETSWHCAAFRDERCALALAAAGDGA
jgi:hypothetical protein